jgi:dCTP deaminase
MADGIKLTDEQKRVRDFLLESLGSNDEQVRRLGESGLLALIEKAGRGAVFTNKDIRNGLRTGDLFIHPFVDEHVNTGSYDITLGKYFYRTNRSTHHTYFNPFSKTDADRYFGEPLSAVIHEQYIEEHGRQPFENIPLDHEVIVLAPGERILGHSHEFAGVVKNSIPQLQARSSIGRIGISVCLDAGWGDVGFYNRWTLEIQNHNDHEHTILPTGERVGQLIFYTIGEVEGTYATDTGHYQRDVPPEELVRTWTPPEMLPQLFRQQRRKALPL